METLARKISQQTLDRISGHLGLEEITGANGPFCALISPAFGDAEIGSMRLWRGERLQKMVYIGMTVAAIGIDSHMIFAFTMPDSPVPNFTLDSVYARLPPGADAEQPEGEEQHAFHLDLIPKCDLGVNHAYLRRVYQPLSETRQRLRAADGIYPALLSTTQRAIMSPWMLARRATPEAYREQVYPAVEEYLSHWLELVDQGLGDIADSIFGETGSSREAASRALIFNREIDPVWVKVDRMLGEATSEQLLAVLRSLGVESAS